ncbi:hypothetical protein RQP53_06610 [Paucibacter sp. APW11]|uniref:Uncharacterized protein n=1 Tax=Roseateles aquae TaxID=3077235 RepID=A0ABU3PB04_9BURK|nr:hypothetical protein [Paucibacter sp. APW11]MDT8998936.1 hypothetical protein [Paucibacter sp. APW11]
MSNNAQHQRIEALLARLRLSMAGWQDLEAPQWVSEIRALEPDAAQLLELEALAQFAEIGDERERAQQQLHYAQQLQHAAQQLGTELAEAAAWRLMHGLQSLLHQHQAALHSAGMAATLYRRCGQRGLAQAMLVSRNNVLFHLELFQELLQSCEALLADPQDISPAFLHRARNGAASACFSLANEAGNEADHRQLMQRALAHHQAALELAEQHGLTLLCGISHTNLSVVNAMLGQTATARQHLAAVKRMPEVAGGRPGWAAWQRYAAALIEAQEEALEVTLGAAKSTESAWARLLALSESLGEDSLNNGPAHESCLHAIVWMGPARGKSLDALQANRKLLSLQRRNKLALSAALGETVNKVLAQPQLEQRQQQLQAQGSVLEQALAQRNAELSLALAKLQTEMTIRLGAEAALQRAHDELEVRVQQRSAELSQASHTLLLQEKQLSLSRLVADSAALMGPPLGQAHQALQQLDLLQPQLQALLSGLTVRRGELDQLLEGLEQSSGVTDGALQALAQQVQRFKALDLQA